MVGGAIDPAELAKFWAHALGWTAAHVEGGGDVELVPGDATSFRLVFQPGARPKTGRNPMHFDLTTSSLEDQRDTVTELLSLGATPVDVGQTAADTHVVLADPEGNELCVIAPGNDFLAGCPRLGAVNGDGTRALGQFFSVAIGWPLVWDEDEETAVQAPDGTGPKLTWSGPPLLPKCDHERFHLHLAPAGGGGIGAALDMLLSLGATRRARGPTCPDAIALEDVDGNALCLVAT